jgi:hypothetical protein
MIRKQIRPGATLTEVLVAIFVMAIGLLALLTLFPIGALSMAQAIKDDRTGHSGKNAYAIWTALNMPNDPLIWNNGLPLAVPGSSTTYYYNPYPTVTPPQPLLAPDLKSAAIVPPWDLSSYPIYIDPIGCKNFQSLGTAVGLAFPSVGNVPPPGPPFGGYSSIPRQPISALLSSATTSILTASTSVQALDRWTTLTDDITFSIGKSLTEPADASLPALSTGAVQRENRYTWAWMARLPNVNEPTQVDLQIVVYSGRSLTNLGETAYPGVFWAAYWDQTTSTDPAPPLGTPQLVPTSTFVDLPYQGPRPNIRNGTWILDATMCDLAVPSNPKPHGYFYRVIGVTDLPSPLPSPPYPANSQGLRLEIQGAFKTTDATFNGTVTVPVPYGVLVVMENVVEVF